MLDSAGSGWLLEANTSPQLSSKAPFLQELTGKEIPQLVHLLLCKQHRGAGCQNCPKGDNDGKWKRIEHSATLDNLTLQRRWLHKKAKEGIPTVAGIPAQVREYMEC